MLLAATDPLGHVLDKTLFETPIGPFTMNTLSLFVASAGAVLILVLAARSIGTGPASEGADRYVTKNRFAHVIEVVVLFLRSNILEPSLGSLTNKFAPFLLTVFFFIWFNNLFGLIPLIDLQYAVTTVLFGEESKVIGGTPTGRLAVTGALALIAFVVWHVAGIVMSGPRAWASHFTAGAPWFMWPVMIPVEVVGAVVKPSALAIRLFANMTAGHVLLAVVIGFTGGAVGAVGVLGGLPVALVAFAGGVAIFFLEVFVATLQAFIFTVLTTIFLSQMVHHHHDDEHVAEAYDKDHAAVDDPSTAVAA